MIKIRLARGGSKKRPHYAIVVANSRSPRDGKFIEQVGRYNPMVEKDHPERLVINTDRAKHWLSVGAAPTDRVARFFGNAGLIAMPVIHEAPKKSLPKKKAQDRMAAETARQTAQEEARRAEVEAAAAAAAAPAPEPAPEPEPAPAPAPVEAAPVVAEAPAPVVEETAAPAPEAPVAEEAAAPAAEEAPAPAAPVEEPSA